MPRSLVGKFFTTRCAVWTLNPDKICRNGFRTPRPLGSPFQRTSTGTDLERGDRQRCARNGLRGVVHPHRDGRLPGRGDGSGGARENARPTPDRLGGARRHVFEKGVRMLIPCRPGLSCISQKKVQTCFSRGFGKTSAVAVGDATGEGHAWKLFLLLPSW